MKLTTADGSNSILQGTIFFRLGKSSLTAEGTPDKRNDYMSKSMVPKVYLGRSGMTSRRLANQIPPALLLENLQ